MMTKTTIELLVATGGGFFPEANAPTTYVASPLKVKATYGFLSSC